MKRMLWKVLSFFQNAKLEGLPSFPILIHKYKVITLQLHWQLQNDNTQ